MNSTRSQLDRLRAFGMSMQLVEAELDRVEREKQIDLGRARDEVWEDDYYPQFDETVRAEAAAMSRYYQIFYCLEKTIRNLIADTLEDAEGANWWNSGRVPKAVHDGVSGRIKREQDSGFTVRSEDPIDYTNFGELGEIIKGNEDIFGGIFTSTRAVERVMANLNMLRGPIAHCSVLAEDEVLRLQLSVRDWFRLMD